MCGIAGILVGEQDRVDEGALRAMTRALAARGPDGEAFHVGSSVGLGHRRLAIIDVDGGQQPLFSSRGEVAIVVNGEFYNFKTLRAELEEEGFEFATASDSEVLVHGYQLWGDDVLDRLEGMFAFALWDEKRKRLLLARDRMGEKPLYWATLPRGGLAFSSELRSLSRCPGIDLSVDPSALARYLVYEHVPAPRSMLAGTRKLEPGTQLVATPGQTPTISRYWDLPFVPESDQLTDGDEAARQLLAALRRSVRQRLVSDVPLGVFLSGGIDSSTVAALASEVRGRKLSTFSIGFEDPSFDESSEARRVARAIGSDHHEETLGAQTVLDFLPAIGQLLDEPIGDSSIVPTHLLARFARQYVTVALGGDGGDELFSGYPTFVADKLAGAIDRAPFGLGRAAYALGRAATSVMNVSTGYFSTDFKLRQFLKGEGHQGARRHQTWLASLAPADALAALAPDVANKVKGDLLDVVDTRVARVATDSPADRLMYFYARGFLGDGVLTKVDRASMALGLEVRAPLLDRKVIELACRVAPQLRLRGLTSKYLLKKALCGILPEETLRRKKQGFAMPISSWLKSELRPLMEEQLSETRLRNDGLFSPAPIRKLVDEHVAGKADHGKPLWTLIAFQSWHKSFTR